MIEITTIEAYKAWRMVGNLVWGIRDREREPNTEPIQTVDTTQGLGKP